MPEFTADDTVRLHYAVHGDGPSSVFFLHWMGGAGEIWTELITTLQPAGFRFIAPDFRGHGRSQVAQCELSAERLARDVLQLADHLGLGSFAVVGHSFGGKVALRLAALAPSRVSALVLLGAVGPGPVPVERAAFEVVLNRAHDHAFISEAFRPWFQVWPRTTIDRAVLRFTQTPEWALRAVAEVAMWTDLTPDIPPYPGPALVIAGAEDPVYGPAYQEAAVLPFVPPSRLVTVANCGHGLFLERPEEIAGELERLLRRISTAP